MVVKQGDQEQAEGREEKILGNGNSILEGSEMKRCEPS